MRKAVRRHATRILREGSLDALLAEPPLALLSLAEHLVDFGHDALACAAVRGQESPDPHGFVAKWLAGEGDPARTA